MAMLVRGTRREQRRGEGGFTLMELMIVMTIIMLLAMIAIPGYLRSVNKAKEAVLKEDLHTMRVAIDSYTVDKEKAPQGLDAGGVSEDCADRPDNQPERYVDYGHVGHADGHQRDAGRDRRCSLGGAGAGQRWDELQHLVRRSR